MSRSPQGLGAWLLQRLSGVYLGGFLLYCTARWLYAPPHNWTQWQAWMTHPLMRIASAGFLLALLAHAWIGMRDILLDYIRPLGMRLALLTLVALVLGGSGLWGLRVLLVTG